MFSLSVMVRLGPGSTMYGIVLSKQVSEATWMMDSALSLFQQEFALFDAVSGPGYLLPSLGCVARGLLLPTLFLSAIRKTAATRDE